MRDDAAADLSGNALVATTSDPSAHHTPSTRAPATAASPPLKAPATRGWLSSVRRPRTSPGPRASALRRTQVLADSDDRRDSALTSSNCTAKSIEPSSPTSLHRTPSLPAIVVQDEHAAGSHS